MLMQSSFEEIIEFFCSNNIPILPCHGINSDGSCTCKKGGRCPSPGKHPLVFRWQLVASCDKQTVLSWIGSGTKSVNLAIRTGMKNPNNGKYLVGTDLDLVDHPMKERLSRYSTTITQRSGSGGSHAFYWSELPIRNSVQLVDEKVDIRGSGGIMVIAPSRHKSGNCYEFTCDLKTTQIQDLPEFLIRKLKVALSRKPTKTEEKQPKKSVSSSSELLKFWNQRSVTLIKTALLNGEKVPIGARNATMHRLLSSDRARGVPTFLKLMEKAKEYLPGFEEPDSFMDEIEGIVKSVMRYPAYNNSHEKVNELYLGWLGKNGYKKEHTLEMLNELDKKFFETLEPSSSLELGVSLKEITERRTKFMKLSGLNRFATYRPQLLAKKLLELGIQKKRTSKGNHWLVRFKNEIPLDVPEPLCKNTKIMESLEMTTELNDESKKKGLKDGDIIEHKGKKVRVELIHTQAKTTVHPREHLYQGRTGYDYNKAMMNLMSRMTEEQMENLETNTLVMNQEATQEWLDKVKSGDVIGVVSNLYLVDNIQDCIYCTKAKPTKTPGCYETFGTTIAIPKSSIDHARELGLLDILWREGKPFGVPETRDMTIVLLHDLEDSDNQKPKRNKKSQ
jgi:putative DNA primase/helicase